MPIFIPAPKEFQTDISVQNGDKSPYNGTREGIGHEGYNPEGDYHEYSDGENIWRVGASDMEVWVDESVELTETKK